MDKPWDWMTEEEKERYKAIWYEVGYAQAQIMARLSAGLQEANAALKSSYLDEGDCYDVLAEAFVDGWVAYRQWQLDHIAELETS